MTKFAIDFYYSASPLVLLKYYCQRYGCIFFYFWLHKYEVATQLSFFTINVPE